VSRDFRIRTAECHSVGIRNCDRSVVEVRSFDDDAPIEAMSAPLGVARCLEVRWNSVGETFDFRGLALSNPTLERSGVYVIRRACDRQAVRLGQATRIRDRLRAHQQDPLVVGSTTDLLLVVWAWVPRSHRDGVEAFLARTLRPEVGERFPAVPSIAVNLP
jgi:hypothetical protein